MSRNNNNYVVNVNIGDNNMTAILTDGENQLADFSFNTPKNDFRKFITILKALVRASEDVAEEKGVAIRELLFNIFADYRVVDERIVNCEKLPVLNKVNLSDFLVEYKGRIAFNYVQKEDLVENNGLIRERLNELIKMSQEV